MTPVASYTKVRNLGYFDTLLADPNGGIQKLFRKYSVHAADASVGYTVKTTDIKDVTHKGDFAKGAVLDSKLVSWVHLEKLSRTSGPKPEGHDTIYLEANINPNPNWVPAYFLPWAPQAMIHMTIPRKGSRNVNDPDPDIFFTAAINGCSVFIQGSPANPTIYHCGGDPDYATNVRTPTEAATFWRNLVLQHGSPGALHGEVNKTHYVTDVTTTNADEKSTVTSRRYEEWLKSELDKTIRVKSVKPWGCVFGIRTGMNWKFHLQENVTTSYATLQKQKYGLLGMRTRKVEVSIREVGRPAVVREIFPDGGACVNFSPLQPISIL